MLDPHIRIATNPANGYNSRIHKEFEVAGTKIGGDKAAVTNKVKYGLDFYRQIGRSGGRRSRNGGFASNVVGPDGLTGRQRASIAGTKGGMMSQRGPNKRPVSVATSEDTVPSRFDPFKGLRKFF